MGGLKAPGRWHHPGLLVVYLANSPASALLEVCVHTSANDIPPEFDLLNVSGPDLQIPALTVKNLPQDWASRMEVTRDLGTDWLRKRESVLLEVPSALVPETINYLFNPLHADASKFKIDNVYTYPFDSRLKE
jgi:RES domain-containing protein